MGAGLALLFFYIIAPFLIPLFLASVFGILCQPIQNKLSQKMAPWLAGMLTTLGLILGFLAPFVTFLVGGTHQLIGFIGKVSLPRSDDSPESLLNHPWLKSIVKFVQDVMPTDREWLKDQAIDLIRVTLAKVSAMLGTTLAQMPSLMLGALIFVIGFYFFLVDGEKLMRFASNLSPMKFEKTEELFHSFERSCRGVVLGLFASALAQGVLMFCFAFGTGIPHPLLWGLATAVLSLVPLLGSAPVGIGLTVYLFSTGHPVAGTFMAIGAVLVGITDNVVRPAIMRGEAEMHPLLALVSVFGALHLFGASGIFLGPIIAAVFVSFLKILVQELKKEKGTHIAPSL